MIFSYSTDTWEAWCGWVDLIKTVFLSHRVEQVILKKLLETFEGRDIRFASARGNGIVIGYWEEGGVKLHTYQVHLYRKLRAAAGDNAYMATKVSRACQGGGGDRGCVWRKGLKRACAQVRCLSVPLYEVRPEARPSDLDTSSKCLAVADRWVEEFEKRGYKVGVRAWSGDVAARVPVCCFRPGGCARSGL